MKINLDDIQSITRLDKSDMLGAVTHTPEQLEEAWDRSAKTVLPASFRKPDKILLLGTGGGYGTSFEMLKSLLLSELTVPLLVCSNYTIPNFVNQDTLVLTGSYSGNTEETLNAYTSAVERRAMVAVFTSGGKLKEQALANKVPIFEVPPWAMPRSAIGYIFPPLLKVLTGLKLIGDKSADIQEAIHIQKGMREKLVPQVPTSENLAKQIAEKLLAKMTVIYAAIPYTDGVAIRLKRQLSENGKVLAMCNLVPHMHHEEMVGWDSPREMTQNFAVILLRDSDDSERIKKGWI